MFGQLTIRDTGQYTYTYQYCKFLENIQFELRTVLAECQIHLLINTPVVPCIYTNRLMSSDVTTRFQVLH